MSDSVRPHRQQPTRLPRPWDSPGKNNGVGCQFLLQSDLNVLTAESARSHHQCRQDWKSENESVIMSDTCDPVDGSLPSSSVHGIPQATILVVGSHSLLQGILPTQGLNPGLLHCRQILFHLSYKGTPRQDLGRPESTM